MSERGARMNIVVSGGYVGRDFELGERSYVTHQCRPQGVA
jgi:hypothetical protein